MSTIEVTHGQKIEIFPDEAQWRQLDRWRRLSVDWWNLMTGMEKSAYSGDMFKTHLGWRKLWQECAQEEYKSKFDRWKNGKVTRCGKNKGKVVEPETGKPPKELTAEHLRKMRGGKIDGKKPGIFIWAEELKRIAAKLKKHPQCAWLGELPTCSGQIACIDMERTLKGLKLGRGMAKRKKGYAVGSIGFTNIAVSIDLEKRVVKFPKAVGEMACGDIGKVPTDASLREARVWREGRRWFCSALFKFDVEQREDWPHEECGVKIAGRAVSTVFSDGEVHRAPTLSRAYSPREEALFQIKSRKASRKKRRSSGWYDAQEALVKEHAYRRNVRADIHHKESRYIADNFKNVTIDSMDIKEMVKKTSRRDKTRKQLSRQGKKPPQIEKKMRKIVLNAGMYGQKLAISYKVKEAGGTVNEAHKLFASTQICWACGKVNPEMAYGRRVMRCECGHRMQRQKNAAGNISEQGKLARKATALLQAAE